MIQEVTIPMPAAWVAERLVGSDGRYRQDVTAAIVERITVGGTDLGEWTFCGVESHFRHGVGPVYMVTFFRSIA